jgi:hypothetical protein
MSASVRLCLPRHGLHDVGHEGLAKHTRFVHDVWRERTQPRHTLSNRLQHRVGSREFIEGRAPPPAPLVRHQRAPFACAVGIGRHELSVLEGPVRQLPLLHGRPHDEVDTTTEASLVLATPPDRLAALLTLLPADEGADVLEPLPRDEMPMT